MYRVGPTNIPGGSRRPFRLSGVGDYQRAMITIPTQSYSNLPSPGSVTGGLGLDLSSLTSSPIFWLAAAGGAYWLWKKYGRG